MKNLGNIIKQARGAKKLLVRQAAAMLDIDPSLLSKFEKNERRPSKELVQKIASLYELDENIILTEWLSDKIVYETQDEDFALNALKVAEKKIKYIITNKSENQ